MEPLHTISGIVEKGHQRGKALGFPTANIALTTHIASGIYISQTKRGNDIHPSLTFIGEAKTFGEILYQSETYLLDFDEIIYGEFLEIQSLEKIRDNEKFVSVALLVEKMKEDEKVAREFFETDRT